MQIYSKPNRIICSSPPRALNLSSPVRLVQSWQTPAGRESLFWDVSLMAPTAFYSCTSPAARERGAAGVFDGGGGGGSDSCCWHRVEVDSKHRCRPQTRPRSQSAGKNSPVFVNRSGVLDRAQSLQLEKRFLTQILRNPVRRHCAVSVL